MTVDTPFAVWSPRYTLTPTIARGLMQIEAARALVEHAPLLPSAEAELRAHPRLRAVHYSTYIEGNRLSISEARAVLGLFASKETSPPHSWQQSLASQSAWPETF